MLFLLGTANGCLAGCLASAALYLWLLSQLNTSDSGLPNSTLLPWCSCAQCPLSAMFVITLKTPSLASLHANMGPR